MVRNFQPDPDILARRKYRLSVTAEGSLSVHQYVVRHGGQIRKITLFKRPGQPNLCDTRVLAQGDDIEKPPPIALEEWKKIYQDLLSIRSAAKEYATAKFGRATPEKMHDFLVAALDVYQRSYMNAQDEAIKMGEGSLYEPPNRDVYLAAFRAVMAGDSSARGNPRRPKLDRLERHILRLEKKTFKMIDAFDGILDEEPDAGYEQRVARELRDEFNKFCEAVDDAVSYVNGAWQEAAHEIRLARPLSGSDVHKHAKALDVSIREAKAVFAGLEEKLLASNKAFERNKLHTLAYRTGEDRGLFEIMDQVSGIVRDQDALAETIKAGLGGGGPERAR